MHKSSQGRFTARNRFYTAFKEVALRLDEALFGGFIDHRAGMRLLVDPLLANYPFEGLPTFTNVRVSRTLQLPLLQGWKTDGKSMSPSGLILVGPETELSKSYNAIKKQIRDHAPISADLTVTRLPRTEETDEATKTMVSNCLSSNDYFMYSGHGSGE